MICGIGTDIVDVARIRRAGARWGERFLKRVFTGKELTYCRTKADPYPHLAARFAAKEAAIKALSSLWETETGRESPQTSDAQVDESSRRTRSGQGFQPPLRLRDVEILNHPTGRPFIILGGAGVGSLDGLLIHLSISHERDLAIATVVLEKTLAQPL